MTDVVARELSDGVGLRVLQQEDAPELAAAYARNRQHLAPWDPVREPGWFEAATQQRVVAGQLTALRAGEALPLVLVRGVEVVGRVNVTGIVRGAFQSAALGYWLDAHLNGRGLMTAAVAAVCEIARDDLALHRLQAGTLLHNEASQRVLTACGFEPIGIAPAYLQIAGRWQDHRLFQRILHD
ncbi:GNAT family N-acetyltransferase [Auraticoccus monumenti]|uniref:[SSU ribosomal protein S5P]-alanine acetyltransferase n=1 Tax=Auraticoccus monumenti TaxID=675864 RepID=A0A1G6XCS7_9ACTN|nr:GNAT family N-acetyltransferase [Auraticoccus monumenti]SDD75958.1 [SSU ribosomal protein S5P]-alanine acetyltransferase [Auraticoccus monumenti]